MTQLGNPESRHRTCPPLNQAQSGESTDVGRSSLSAPNSSSTITVFTSGALPENRMHKGAALRRSVQTVLGSSPERAKPLAPLAVAISTGWPCSIACQQKTRESCRIAQAPNSCMVNSLTGAGKTTRFDLGVPPMHWIVPCEV